MAPHDLRRPFKRAEAQGTLPTAPSTAPPWRPTPSSLLGLFPQPPLWSKPEPTPEPEPKDSPKFRFFWLSSKLSETGECDLPSQQHRYRISPVPVYNCDQAGLSAAYTGVVPYVKDGLLFYNKYDLFFFSMNNVKCFECLLLNWLSYSYECDYRLISIKKKEKLNKIICR